MGIEISAVFLRDTIIYSNVIALMCVGITTTYMTTKVPNFAQGSFVSAGIYVTITVVSVLGLNPYVALPFGLLTGGALGFLMYQFAIRPLIRRKATIVTLMVTTLAVDIFFMGVLNVYADYVQTGLKIISRSVNLRYTDFTIAGFYSGVLITSSILLAMAAVLLYLFLNKTKFGVALRAVVEDADLAGAMGINVQRVYRFAWFISGSLAGLAGALTPLFSLSSTNTGSLLIIIMFAGALLGGVYSIFGTFLGGLAIGFVDQFGSNLLGQIVSPDAESFRPVIPLMVMVAVLLLAPTGIGGLRLRRSRRKR